MILVYINTYTGKVCKGKRHHYTVLLQGWSVEKGLTIFALFFGKQLDGFKGHSGYFNRKLIVTFR